MNDVTATRARRRPEHSVSWVRWLGLAGVALLAAVTAAGAGPGPVKSGEARLAMSPDRVRETLRRHTFRTLDGRRLTLADFGGDVVVVNFWASWCAPCRKELPQLDALNTELANKGGRVLAVSIDEDAQNAARFVEKHRLGFAVVHDGPDGLARELDLPHVPMTLVLDRTGAVAYTSSGADERSLAALGDLTRRLVAAEPTATSTSSGDLR